VADALVINALAAEVAYLKMAARADPLALRSQNLPGSERGLPFICYLQVFLSCRRRIRTFTNSSRVSADVFAAVSDRCQNRLDKQFSPLLRFHTFTGVSGGLVY
jgi:hypothetical protein